MRPAPAHDRCLSMMAARDTAAALQTESGFTLESSAVSQFRTGVLTGEWDLLERLLLELPAQEIADLVVRRRPTCALS